MQLVLKRFFHVCENTSFPVSRQGGRSAQATPFRAGFNFLSACHQIQSNKPSPARCALFSRKNKRATPLAVARLITDKGDAFAVGRPGRDVDGALAAEELGQDFDFSTVD